MATNTEKPLTVKLLDPLPRAPDWFAKARKFFANLLVVGGILILKYWDINLGLDPETAEAVFDAMIFLFGSLSVWTFPNRSDKARPEHPGALNPYQTRAPDNTAKE